MRLWLARVSRGTRVGLVPADEHSEAVVAKMAEGECAQFTLIRPRSLPMHRRYFAICRAIGANQDPPRDEESIDHELRILAGHFDSMRLRDRRSNELFEVRTPKRIAFHRLTHDEWLAIWPSLEKAGIERFGAEYWIEMEAA